MRTSLSTYIKSDYRKTCIIALTVVVLLCALAQSILNESKQITPPIGSHIKAMSIAVSELKYGLTGHRGYTKVLDILYGTYGTTGRPIPENIVYANPKINYAIRKALSVDDVSSDGIHFMYSSEAGLISYYKLAFKIFGYKAESVFCLYYLLLAVSVFVFVVTFHRNISLLYILLLFACGHLIVVAAAPVVSAELPSVSTFRFFPVLTILPALYLALLISGEGEFSKVTLAGAVVQALILAFIILARTSAGYQLMFLVSTPFSIALLRYWEKARGRDKYLPGMRFWPLIIVLAGFFLLKMYLTAGLHQSYTEVTTRHNIWHAVYIGLAGHPDSESRYGIVYGDLTGFRVVERRAKELGLNFDMDDAINRLQWGKVSGNETEIPLIGDKAEVMLREEFLGILKKDPKFVIESYLYNLARCFGFHLRFIAVQNVFKWVALAVVALGALFVGKTFLERWPRYLCLFVFQFAFALLPPVLVSPQGHIMADSGLLFTLIIFMLFSELLCHTGLAELAQESLRKPSIRGKRV